MSDPEIIRRLVALEEWARRPRAESALSGTFTPAFAGSGGGGVFTYSFQAGTYTRMDDWAHIWIDVAINTFTSAPAGNLWVTGLPFTQSANRPFASATIGYTSAGLATIIRALINPSDNKIIPVTAAGASIAASVLSAGAEICLHVALRI